MPGLIKAEDIAAVKERVAIDDVVGQHVTLRRAGMGSLKGLCPFHDEKTPSFTVRPAYGSYHCFGCGKSGDVISFVMEVDHLTFTEAVERLAAGVGMELRYEAGSGPRDEGLGRRTRLLEAHRVAEEFYSQALISSAEARAGRDFLRGRGFTGKDAARFGVGYAPRGGEVLAAHLRGKGFTEQELTVAGLVGKGRRGLYDRFRGRVVWPIRDITGDTVGFGARRIYEDDRIEAKYLNTAETPIYKKTKVLYGLDLAKKRIAQDRRAVVVEGYTDVMAAHLSGVEQAVATCGTAFGADHVSLLRRLLHDDEDARVIFTFDGDKAGQAAAMKAFDLNEQWAARSFVAVADGGQDPCELRQSGGEEAVRALVEGAEPMFAFALRTTLTRFDLDRAEGRVQASRAAARLLLNVRDGDRHREYADRVAASIGIDREAVASAVRRAQQEQRERPRRHVAAGETPRPVPEEPALPVPDLRSPLVQAERQLLQALIQFPGVLPAGEWRLVAPDDFTAVMHRTVFEAVLAADPGAPRSAAGWTDAVRQRVPPVVQPLVSELAVTALPTRLDPMTGRPEARYVHSLSVRLRQERLQRQRQDLFAALRREESAGRPTTQLSRDLSELELTLASLRSSLQ